MNLQARIRKELEKAEAKCNYYWGRHRVAYYYDLSCMYYDLFVWWSGRRRFYLKYLLKAQLKEFDHG